LEFNVPFQHKYGYIRDEIVVVLVLLASLTTLVVQEQQLLTGCVHVSEQ